MLNVCGVGPLKRVGTRVLLGLDAGETVSVVIKLEDGSGDGSGVLMVSGVLREGSAHSACLSFWRSVV